MEGAALERLQLLRRHRTVAVHARRNDIDQPVGAVEPPPQIIILAVGAAEEGAEAVELDPFQHRRRAAGADRGRVRRRAAEIGSAAGRESGGQYVMYWVGDLTLNNKTIPT